MIFSKTSYEWKQLMIKGDKTVSSAMMNIPIKETEYYALIHNSVGVELSFDHAKSLNILMRYTNPLCSNCGNNGPNVELIRCEKCFLVFYCNLTCKEHHKYKHNHYCCNIHFDYDPNDDPYAPMILKEDKNHF